MKSSGTTGSEPKYGNRANSNTELCYKAIHQVSFMTELKKRWLC